MTVDTGTSKKDPRKAEYIHDAFISYSRKDKIFALELERVLERYKPPRSLEVPHRHLDVFRDENDFTAGDYAEILRKNLINSAKLIVVCSPNARMSHFVDDEIRQFVRIKGSTDGIIPIIISGIPNYEAGPGQEQEKAFPQALYEVMQMPLAINYRGIEVGKQTLSKGAFESSWYRLLANIYGLSRSVIEQRDKKNQLRIRNLWIAGLSAIATVFAALAVWALVSRHLAEERSKMAMSSQLVSESRRVNNFTSLLLAVEANTILNSTLTHINLSERLEKFWNLERVLWDRETTWHPLARTVDGRFVATASRNGKIRLWRFPAAELITELEANTDDVVCLAFSKNGMVLASGDSEGRITIWNVDEQKRLMTLPESAPGPIVSISVNADGTQLVAAAEKDIMVWDLRNKKTMLLFRGQDDINTVAISPNERFIAAGGDDEHLRIWDLKTLTLLRDWRAHTAEVNAVAFSPDGRILASAGGDRAIWIWDIVGKKSPVKLAGSADIIRAIAFNKTGKRLVSGGREGAIRVWDLSKMEEIQLDLRGQDVNAVTVLPNGNHIISSGSDGSVAMWNVRTLHPIAELIQQHHVGSQIFSLAVSPNGRFLASGGKGRDVQVWDFDNKISIEPVWLGNGSTIRSLAFSPNSRLIAAGNETGDLRILDIALRKEISASLDGHRGAIFTLAFHPQERWLASGGEDGIVRIWDLDARGKRVTEIDQLGETIRSLSFNAQGDRLAAGLGDGRVILWRWTNGSAQRLWSVAGHEGSVSSVIFSPISNTLISSGDVSDSSIRMWETTSGTPVGEPIRFQIGGVSHAKISADGSRLVLAGGKRAAVIDIKSKKTIAYLTVPSGGWASSVSFAYDKDHFIVAAGDHVLLFDISLRNLARLACKKAGRDLTEEEWQGIMGNLLPRPSSCKSLNRSAIVRRLAN